MSFRVSPEFDSLYLIIENFLSSLSGDQLWSGAAAILNKNPTMIIKKPKLQPWTILWLSDTEIKLNIDSKLVNPVNVYTKPEPNKIREEDNPPNKKYFNPADVAGLESLNKVDKIYNPNDCNSILKYIDSKSEEDISNKDPNELNKIINEYWPPNFVEGNSLYSKFVFRNPDETEEFNLVINLDDCKRSAKLCIEFEDLIRSKFVG